MKFTENTKQYLISLTKTQLKYISIFVHTLEETILLFGYFSGMVTSTPGGTLLPTWMVLFSRTTFFRHGWKTITIWKLIHDDWIFLFANLTVFVEVINFRLLFNKNLSKTVYRFFFLKFLSPTSNTPLLTGAMQYSFGWYHRMVH